jgi:hypothetical protein
MGGIFNQVSSGQDQNSSLKDTHKVPSMFLTVKDDQAQFPLQKTNSMACDMEDLDDLQTKA